MDRLGELLAEMSEKPHEKERIEKEIQSNFVQERTVMVLDMSGFSRTTQHSGILTFLSMIQQMRSLAVPVIEELGGTVVKAEADNLFCLFEKVEDAVTAGTRIIASLTEANDSLPEESKLYVSIGIGHGEILNVAGEDIWGSEVNLASKLGEDIAKLGDILLTSDAWVRAKGAGISATEATVEVSGLELVYYSVD